MANYPRHRRNAATPPTDSSKVASSMNVTVAPVCLAFVTSRSGRDACRGSSLVVPPSASGISGARMACTSSVWGWLASSPPLRSNSSTCPLARASSVSCAPTTANPRARYCCISRSTVSAVVLASCSCSFAVFLLDRDARENGRHDGAPRALHRDRKVRDLNVDALGNGDGLLTDSRHVAPHHTVQTTSPPTPRFFAAWPVRRPCEVDTMATPRPPRTPGSSFLPA